MASRLEFASILICVLAGRAPAQTFNVDFGPAGSPGGVTPPTYAGPAASAGTWNIVTTTAVTALVATNGAASPVTVRSTAGPGFFEVDHPNVTGADVALLEDYYRPADCAADLVFENLAPGEYVVHTVVVKLPGGAVDVRVPGSIDPAQWVWGTWNGSYAQGTNFARHRVTVSNGQLVVHVEPVECLHDYLYVNGIQLEKVSSPGSALCFGTASCPCGNPGGGTVGCANSTGLGAILRASGSQSVLVDDLDFSAGQLPATTACLLYAGNNVVNGGAGAPFGDGLRCASGGVVRLGVTTSSAGSAAWGPGLASAGGWSAGSVRVFQTWYRNPAGPCGSGWNLSNAVSVTFTP